MKENIVLFLGAGFSKGIGLPTMNVFGPYAKNHLSRIDRPGHDNRFAVPDLLRAGKMFIDFQNYCKNAESHVSINVENMEEVFGIAECLHQSGIESIELNNEKVPINELLSNIKLWLWKNYHEFPPLNQERQKEVSEANDIFKNFVKFLKDNNLSDIITVITTNYDLVLEYYFWDSNIKCTYPIQLEHADKIVVVDRSNYDVFALWGEQPPNVPVLCKLHGSINYFESEDKFFIATDIANPGEKFGKSIIPEPRRPAVFAQDAVWHMQNRDKKHLTPAIIAPTYAKLQPTSWLSDIWSQAFQSLMMAKTFIFIGYSLPQSDGFMFSFVRAAMAARNKKDSLKVCVINPDETVFPIYKSLFSKNNNQNDFHEETFRSSWEKKILQRYLLRQKH